jgi:SWI/SNF-related matrix-associated actin-dependent regulator of chromatin subfamily A member 5
LDRTPPTEWEDYCLTCYDGGELVLCEWCPMVFHPGCVPDPVKAKRAARGGARYNARSPDLGFECGHHRCTGCSAPDTDVPMLYRCAGCPEA